MGGSKRRETAGKHKLTASSTVCHDLAGEVSAHLARP